MLGVGVQAAAGPVQCCVQATPLLLLLLQLSSSLDVSAGGAAGTGNRGAAAAKLAAVLKERPYSQQLPAEERGSPLGVALVALSGGALMRRCCCCLLGAVVGLRLCWSWQPACMDSAPALSCEHVPHCFLLPCVCRCAEPARGQPERRAAEEGAAGGGGAAGRGPGAASCGGAGPQRLGCRAAVPPATLSPCTTPVLQVAADLAPALSDASPTIQTVRSLWRLHK